MTNVCFTRDDIRYLIRIHIGVLLPW